MGLLARMARQLAFRMDQDRRASWFAKLRLGIRYDCYVSPRADVYFAHRIQLARYVRIAEGVMLNFRSGSGTGVNLVLGEGTKIMPGARLIPQQGSIRIGANCTIQYGCVLYGVGGLEIGNDTRIAAHTVITPMNHVYADPSRPIHAQGETAKGVRIGNDVWLGTGVKIMDGVEIGDGCVVGAGSVVTRSLPPYSVAVGVPARVQSIRGAERSLETARAQTRSAECVTAVPGA